MIEFFIVVIFSIVGVILIKATAGMIFESKRDSTTKWIYTIFLSFLILSSQIKNIGFFISIAGG